MEVEHVTGAAALRERIEGFLVRDEARHNLALGILSTARADATAYPEVHAWLVRDGARVVGAALRTPPHNLLLGRRSLAGKRATQPQRRDSPLHTRLRLRPLGGRGSHRLARGLRRADPERDQDRPGLHTARASQTGLRQRGHRCRVAAQSRAWPPLLLPVVDLANPTSNAIYVRLGYEPVCDSRELAFHAMP